jgi:hypothetical protein
VEYFHHFNKACQLYISLFHHDPEILALVKALSNLQYRQSIDVDFCSSADNIAARLQNHCVSSNSHQHLLCLSSRASGFSRLARFLLARTDVLHIVNSLSISTTVKTCSTNVNNDPRQ